MNPSRLAELERQRALLREHLAWLEREIARETTGVAVAAQSTLPEWAPVASPASATAATVQTAGELSVQPAHDAARSMPGADEYQPDPANAAQSARRGCLVATVSALVLLVASFVALYFFRYSDRPLVFARPPESAAKK